jgi:hypothetical protein
MLLSLLVFLSSCGSSSDNFRLTGRFRNLNQGSFYIFNPERGKKDTIQVRDGRFEYQRDIDIPEQLILMFPNFSEMVIFAEPGVSLTMKGDASHLRETTVKGSKANEEMTEFRLAVVEQTPPEQRRLAQLYVNDHPSSPIVLYLVQHYFLQSPDPDYQMAHRLCQTIVDQQPDNKAASQLLSQLESLKNNTSKGPLPRFSVKDANGRVIDNKLLKSDVNVIFTWASWNHDSQSMQHMVSRAQRDNKGRLSVISICLDAEKDSPQMVLGDSIAWYNVSDGLMWETPILSQLGMATVCGNIVVDKKGNIIDRDLPSQKLTEKLEKLLQPSND